MIDYQQLILEYDSIFYNRVQNLVIKRKNLGINQSKMSFYTKKSLGTIQNFENYKCKDSFLLFAYKKILDNF